MTPPRLHVLTAPASPAMVIRRGPAEAVATVGWDRDSHAFVPGQWLRGRLYEHRSDLSPDGRHRVYFAARGGGHAWTAMSRAPRLRAVLFLPQTSTWCGGAFDAEGRLWLNGAAAPEDRPDGLRPAELHATPHSTDDFHPGGTFPAMLERRGWRREGEGTGAVLTRDRPGGGRIEQRFVVGTRGRAIVSARSALLDARGAREETGWEWAEPWRDRLQVAAQGALWGIPSAGGAARTLRDFSGTALGAIRASHEGVAG